MLLSDISFPKHIHAVSHRKDGDQSFSSDSGEDIAVNRVSFIKRNNIPIKQVVASHARSGGICEVSQKDWGKGVFSDKDALEASILVTGDINTFLYMNSEDCLAMSFFDPIHHICAVAHVNASGAHLDIPSRTVTHLQNAYQTDPQRLLVQVSSTVTGSSCHFPDTSNFQAEVWDQYISYTSEGVLHIDWVRYAVDQLGKAGVSKKNISQSHGNLHSNHHFENVNAEHGKKIDTTRHAVISGWMV